MEKVLLWTFIGIMAVIGLWAWFAGPCWLYTFASAADIPGRCLGVGN